MNNETDPRKLKKQVEMYFDRELDAQSADELIQRVNSDPSYYQAYKQELIIRDNLRRHIHRPSESSQLIQAIKNQIGL
jgi:hypothetical protein